MNDVRKDAVVIERAAGNYSAYVSDLPGCISVGDTVEDTERNIREAIALLLVGLREAGDPVSEPSTVVKYVEAS